MKKTAKKRYPALFPAVVLVMVSTLELNIITHCISVYPSVSSLVIQEQLQRVQTWWIVSCGNYNWRCNFEIKVTGQEQSSAACLCVRWGL